MITTFEATLERVRDLSEHRLRRDPEATARLARRHQQWRRQVQSDLKHAVAIAIAKGMIRL